MTAEQLKAADPSHSVWVSASAGSGKTKVLTDRVLRLLLSGEPPGSILCITYTKAAAAEMMERIESELARWAVAGEDTLKEALTKLSGASPADAMLKRARQLFALVIDAPERLRVQTIHGFCQSIIARFPLESGVPTHVKVLDEHDASEMLKEAKARLLRDSSEDPALSAVLRSLAQQIAESTLEELLQKIVTSRKWFMPVVESQHGHGRFSLLLREALGVPADASISRLEKQCFTYTDAQRAALRRVVALMATDGGKYNIATAEAMAAWLEKRIGAEQYADCFFTDKGTLRVNLFTKPLAKAYPEVAEVINEEATRAEAFRQTARTLRVIQSSEQIMVLADTVLRYYAEDKARQGCMDYDDLILHTVNLFRRSSAASWVLYKLDGSINHLLVDEAQDTSSEQWQIVEALVEEFFSGSGACDKHRTVFVVGDEKQSIFSFQGADPALFEDIRLRMTRKAQEAGMPLVHVRLNTSFRSAPAVLATVDEVFASPDVRDGLVFSEAAVEHTAFRSDAIGRVEIWPLVDAPRSEKSTIWERISPQPYTPSAEQVMAEKIAQTIQGWFDEQRLLPSRGRSVEPGDIMILLRRRGDFAEAMIRSLKRRGIAVAGADRLRINDHIVVMDCMALADFLLLPSDDLTLAALLKSPFIGLGEEALFELACGRQKQSLWQRLRQQEEKYPEAVAFLSEMLAKTDYMRPYELFCHALLTLGKRKDIMRRLGIEAEDPLRELLSLALQYEQSHPPSLQGFMHWIRSNDTEIKRDMDKSRKEVRILTVHASKGLQAPIIFLPDTTSMPLPPSKLQWLETATMKMPVWAPFSDMDDKHLRQLKQQAKEESLREYRRLLYVALTRAESEMYICGWKGEKSIPEECWYSLITNAIGNKPGWEQVEGVSVKTSGTFHAPAKKDSSTQHYQPVLPAWADAPAPAEPNPTRPLSPSRSTEKEIQVNAQALLNAQMRGVLTHRLLQFLPQYEGAQRKDMLTRFMEFYGEAFSESERGEIARQVLALLDHPEYAEVFSGNSVAEVPVVGIVEDGQGEPVTVAGQIDRLVVTEREVMIVDFKTGVPPEGKADVVPAGYQRQLGLYRKLVERIYPDKTVRCAVIWTALPKLVELKV